MPKHAVLITGAAGEIGHGLIDHLSRHSSSEIVTLDLQQMPPELAPMVTAEYTGSVLDNELLQQIFADHDITTVHHLAALLSTSAEHRPLLAHQVNVEGTLKLLAVVQEVGERLQHPVTFLYPSSIAVHGLPDLVTKEQAGRLKEGQWLTPTTIYGANKLYCEQLGYYFSRYYRQLDPQPPTRWTDFRAIRFPGLISALTLPTGGTSDYAPEMIHAAARGAPYSCFVRPDTRIPFMAMPDAVTALVRLAQAPRQALTQHVYAITAFNPSAAEIRDLVLAAFPEASIDFAVDAARQSIVDTWPADVDDSAARRDWGFDPSYDLQRAFTEYLIPTIRDRYLEAEPAT